MTKTQATRLNQMTTNLITLECDATDYADIQREFALRQQARDHQGTILPNSASNLAGALVAELVRDVEEYRSIMGFAQPPKFEGLNRAGHVTNSDLISKKLWCTLEEAICSEFLKQVEKLPPKELPAQEWAEMFRRAALRCAHGLIVSTAENRWRIGCVPCDCPGERERD